MHVSLPFVFFSVLGGFGFFAKKRWASGKKSLLSDSILLIVLFPCFFLLGGTSDYRSAAERGRGAGGGRVSNRLTRGASVPGHPAPLLTLGAQHRTAWHRRGLNHGGANAVCLLKP